MFKTLRSRLLFSYAMVIAAVLTIVAGFLLLVLVVSQQTRLQPQIEQLVRISRTTQDNLRRGEVRSNPRSVNRVLNRTAEQLNTRILLLDATQTVTYDSEDQIKGRTVDINDLRPQQAMGPMMGGGAITGPARVGRWESDERRWLAHVQDLPGWMGTGRIVHAIPENTALGTFRNTFLLPLLSAGGAGLVVGLVFAWRVSRSVVGPLRQMAAASEAMAGGDYGRQVDEDGPQEVRRVAQSFNHMSRRVLHTQQAQKDFVANVSHDLKTPLTSIQGWSQAIVDGAAAKPEQQQRAAEVIHTEAARMGRMVNQLLTLAKLEAGRVETRREPVAVARVARDVVRSLSKTAEGKAITLTAAVDETAETAVVNGDYDQLVQMVMNLVQNGVAHTPPSGTVTVGVGVAQDEAVLTVADNGRGIAAADQARIFERFYQADRARTGADRGTGLGLAIVQHIVEAHHGRITVDSTPDVGSTFTIRLPLPAAAAPPTR